MMLSKKAKRQAAKQQRQDEASRSGSLPEVDSSQRQGLDFNSQNLSLQKPAVISQAQPTSLQAQSASAQSEPRVKMPDFSNRSTAPASQSHAETVRQSSRPTSDGPWAAELPSRTLSEKATARLASLSQHRKNLIREITRCKEERQHLLEETARTRRFAERNNKLPGASEGWIIQLGRELHEVTNRARRLVGLHRAASEEIEVLLKTG